VLTNLKNKFKKTIASCGLKNTCLIKIVMIWIFTCKINKNYVFIKEKEIISTFYKTKVRNTITHGIKNINYLNN